MPNQTAARAESAPPAVTAQVTFAVHTGEKPYQAAYDRPGKARTNMAHRAETVTIANARAIESALSVDVHGFEIVRAPSAVQDFWDEAQTLALGHPEVAEIVKRVTGAKRVVVFDHTRRRRTLDAIPSVGASGYQPANRAHVDQTVLSGPKRVREVMGAQADVLLQGRAAVINVWRPIAHAARDWPLAVADARSVSPDDLIASDLLFPHRTGETYGVAHSPAQRWYYTPDLSPDEVLLLKCWDSDERVARFTPHTGFEDPTTPPGTPPRESIEFRTMAFF